MARQRPRALEREREKTPMASLAEALCNARARWRRDRGRAGAEAGERGRGLRHPGRGDRALGHARGSAGRSARRRRRRSTCWRSMGRSWRRCWRRTAWPTAPRSRWWPGQSPVSRPSSWSALGRRSAGARRALAARRGRGRGRLHRAVLRDRRLPLRGRLQGQRPAGDRRWRRQRRDRPGRAGARLAALRSRRARGAPFDQRRRDRRRAPAAR